MPRRGAAQPLGATLPHHRRCRVVQPGCSRARFRPCGAARTAATARGGPSSHHRVDARPFWPSQRPDVRMSVGRRERTLQQCDASVGRTKHHHPRRGAVRDSRACHCRQASWRRSRRSLTSCPPPRDAFQWRSPAGGVQKNAPRTNATPGCLCAEEWKRRWVRSFDTAVRPASIGAQSTTPTRATTRTRLMLTIRRRF